MEKVVIKQCKLLFILFVGLVSASVASAQSERFLWEVHSPHILSISQRTMDSVGNLYVAGVFESQAEINGQYICPADTDAWLFASRGVFIAKFDTAGTMLWCRSVKDWKEGSGNVCGFSINNGKISFSFTYGSFYLQTPQDIYLSNRHCWLHFIDTTYYGFIDGVMQPYGTLPYRSGDVFFYNVSLDLDGNRLDTKTAYGLNGMYGQDSRGNHYFLKEILIPRNGYGPTPYITLNDDSTSRFYYPLCNGDYYPTETWQRGTPFLVKIDPTWTDVSFFQLTDSTNGFVNSTGDSVFAHSAYGYDFADMKIDSDDGIYITGFSSGPQSRGSHSFPMELKFNSGVSIVQENDMFIDFIMKVDTMGNVLWVKQFYYDALWDSNSNSLIYSYFDGIGGVAFDSNYLYYSGSFFSVGRFINDQVNAINNVYFDINHNDTLSFPNPKQYYVASVIELDKSTGDYITHWSLYADSIGTRMGKGCSSYVNKNYIIALANNLNNHCTYRYDRQTDEWTIYDTIISSGASESKGFYVSKNGFIVKAIDNSQYSLTSPNFFIPSNNANILYYYDSLLDKRRHKPVTHIAEPESIHVDVLPNPTSGVFSVATDELVTAAEVYNQQGVLIVQKIYGTKSAVFDLRRYPCGVYLLRVYTPKGVAVRKIIKI